ncbi:MAG: hypothetical protein JST30_00040 [Armatimonadetes bacterium]|nr:hypothetical protein [Armatimonadota bacterium]
MDITPPKTYVALVDEYIAKGERLMTAASPEEGRALEEEMQVLFDAIQAFEDVPGFPSGQDQTARLRFLDWEDKHGVPDDGP